MSLGSEGLRIVTMALKEDRAGKDLTSSMLISRGERAVGKIVCRERGVLCGTDFASAAFRRVDPSCKVRIEQRDGKRVSPGDIVMTVRGKTSKILSGERTALNFLQHLSGIATLTRRYVDAVKGSHARILDTRKTIPGLRSLQKYAVKCGGGMNHRMNLEDMAMVKDNHFKTAVRGHSGIMDLKARLPGRTTLIIEAKTIAQTRLALRARADVILLDNMSVALMKMAMRIIRSSGRRTLIEVSGGINLKTIRRIAGLGVDRISIGAITHSAPALDLSLDINLVS